MFGWVARGGPPDPPGAKGPSGPRPEQAATSRARPSVEWRFPIGKRLRLSGAAAGRQFGPRLSAFLAAVLRWWADVAQGIRPHGRRSRRPAGRRVAGLGRPPLPEDRAGGAARLRRRRSEPDRPPARGRE